MRFCVDRRHLQQFVDVAPGNLHNSVNLVQSSFWGMSAACNFPSRGIPTNVALIQVVDPKNLQKRINMDDFSDGTG